MDHVCTGKQEAHEPNGLGLWSGRRGTARYFATNSTRTQFVLHDVDWVPGYSSTCILRLASGHVIWATQTKGIISY